MWRRLAGTPPSIAGIKRNALDATLQVDSISRKRSLPGGQSPSPEHDQTPRSYITAFETDFPNPPSIEPEDIFGRDPTDFFLEPAGYLDVGHTDSLDAEGSSNKDDSAFWPNGGSREFDSAHHADDFLLPEEDSDSYPVVQEAQDNTIAVDGLTAATPRLWSNEDFELMSGVSALNSQLSICFGAINAAAWSSAQREGETACSRVDLRPCGSIVMLYSQRSQRYMGSAECPVLTQVQDRFTVKLNASLNLNPQHSERSKSRPDRARSQNRKCTLRIVVFGMANEQHAVGELLSEANLFLQHPTTEECGAAAEYCNPHFLVRPGASLSGIGSLPATPYDSEDRPRHILADTEKSQLIQVFDSVCASEDEIRDTASPRIICTMQDHQLIALYKMRERESGKLEGTAFPSIWELNPSGETAMKYRHCITQEPCDLPKPLRGGILADEMGLGKTLTTLALVCSSLDSLDASKDRRPSTKSVMTKSMKTLVIAPVSTILSWTQQIERHIQVGKLQAVVYHGTNRLHLTEAAFGDADMVLSTYDILRRDWQVEGPLYRQEWYRVVLDEAHRIRNPTSLWFKAACAVRAQRRWCLTGTPIQNSLRDYGTLLTFLTVHPFQSQLSFGTWIAKPLRDQQPDSMRKFRNLVRATCLRRTKAMLKESCQLPERSSETEEVTFSAEERQLYDFFADRCHQLARGLGKANSDMPQGVSYGRRNILTLIQFLRQICDHGLDLLPRSAVDAWRARDNTQIGWSTMHRCNKTCRACGTVADELSTSTSSTDVDQAWICSDCSNVTEENSPDRSAASLDASISQPIPAGEEMHHLVPSTKVKALLKNLRAAKTVLTSETLSHPVKSVVFSCWTNMLDLIQQAIVNEGFVFERIDGKTSLEHRARALKRFKSDVNCTIMLASIKSVGEGVDLTSATHVHLMEPQWNPMTEAQAVDRVHRIGQKRKVFITQYIMSNSVETYVQEVQNEKLKLIHRSINSDRLLADEGEGLLERLKSILNRSNDRDITVDAI